MIINVIVEHFCKELVIEVETENEVPTDLRDAANKLRLELNPDAVDVKKYIVAFFKKLLLQREKLDKCLLIEQVSPMITKMWQEVLSSLEENNRKVVKVDHGSIIFTLFCPTITSCEQLQEKIWNTQLEDKMRNLFRILGMTFTQ